MGRSVTERRTVSDLAQSGAQIIITHSTVGECGGAVVPGGSSYHTPTTTHREGGRVL